MVVFGEAVGKIMPDFKEWVSFYFEKNQPQKDRRNK